MAACNELNFLFEIDLFFHHPRFENYSSSILPLGARMSFHFS